MMKVGILGGGQLGRMLLQAAANYYVETYILEADEDCPSAHLCHHFVKGNIRDFDTVYQFGKNLDAITIEIENVNIEALEKLESEGVAVYPKPSVLRIIKNKIAQKNFYQHHQIPTASFIITNNLEELQQQFFLPSVHKLAEGGYDGRGVQLLLQEEDLQKGFDAPAVLEKKIDVKKEIAQLIAVDREGQFAIYPSVEMVFNPALNMLDYQLCPAELSQEVLWKAEVIALSVIRPLQSPGIFAVELMVDQNDEVYVNETAPRVHNSGHHTIEAHYSSQFDMLWRIILGYPLGNTKYLLPSVMVNLVGRDGNNGAVQYDGLHDILQIENAFLHLYGKHQTKSGRKMGHVTIMSADKADLIHKANKVKQLVNIYA